MRACGNRRTGNAAHSHDKRARGLMTGRADSLHGDRPKRNRNNEPAQIPHESDQGHVFGSEQIGQDRRADEYCYRSGNTDGRYREQDLADPLDCIMQP